MKVLLSSDYESLFNEWTSALREMGAEVQFFEKDIDPQTVAGVLVIDAGYGAHLNLDDIRDYPAPRVILTTRRDLTEIAGPYPIVMLDRDYVEHINHWKYTNPERLFSEVVVLYPMFCEVKANDVVKTSGNRYVTHTEVFKADTFKSRFRENIVLEYFRTSSIREGVYWAAQKSFNMTAPVVL